MKDGAEGSEWANIRSWAAFTSPWMQRVLHTSNTNEEEGDLHAEQTCRGALSMVIEAG